MRKTGRRKNGARPRVLGKRRYVTVVSGRRSENNSRQYYTGPSRRVASWPFSKALVARVFTDVTGRRRGDNNNRLPLPAAEVAQSRRHRKTGPLPVDTAYRQRRRLSFPRRISDLRFHSFHHTAGRHVPVYVYRPVSRVVLVDYSGRSEQCNAICVPAGVPNIAQNVIEMFGNGRFRDEFSVCS